MREIKFRAWDGEKMHDVKNICFEGRPIVTLQYNPVIKKFLDDVVLMQYTGLKDKSGKEICEGDIVLFEEGTKDLIVWDSEWQFHTKENLDNSQSNFDECGLELIGNVYDNEDC